MPRPFSTLRITSSVENFSSYDDAPSAINGDYVYRHIVISPAFLDYLRNNNLCPEPLRANADFNDRFISLCLDANTDMLLRLHFYQEEDEMRKRLRGKEMELQTARIAQESAEARIAELEADLTAALRSLQMLRELPEVQAGSGS